MTRAELHRQLSSITFSSLLAAAVAMNVVAMLGTLSASFAVTAPHATAAEHTAQILGLAFGATLFSMIFGVLVATRDISSGFVVRQSFLGGGPVRHARTKALALLVPAVAFAVLAALTGIVVALVALPHYGVTADVTADGRLIVLGVLVAVTAATFFGYYLGWLVRGTIVALVLAVGWTLVAESLLIAWQPELGRFLPGGAEQMLLLDTSVITDPLPVGVSYAIYLGWLVVLGAVAMVRTQRRDVA